MIGIYVYSMDGAIIKNLSQRWYPFGDYESPIDGFVKRKPISQAERNIYQTKRDLPNIHVGCIVGMNGAGKSTIIDLLYRILNNVAYFAITKAERPIMPDVELAKGVDADLYYEIGGLLYRLECHDDDIQLYKQGKKVNIDKDAQAVLENFFYTIGFNYSIYAFNEKDYESEDDTSINGKWLKGMFHKNDGYWVPMTLVPKRDDGLIDINRENYLAEQRIMCLSILSRAKGQQFPAGYYPEKIEYKLNEKYQGEKWDKFIREQTEYNGDRLTALASAMKEEWKKRLNGIALNGLRNDKDVHIALFYLAYKTLKICLTYNDFHVQSDIGGLEPAIKRENEVADALYKMHIQEFAQYAINTITEHKDNHVTMKIRQCLNYLKNRDRYAGKDDILVEDFMGNLKLETYNDVASHLLPPFFTTDIKFKKLKRQYTKQSSWENMRAEFSLSRMSSGEKQILNAVSYVLYHLNNLQDPAIQHDDVTYKYVNLIFDEAELYYHPDYQRRFLGMLLESLYWAKINRRKIRGINILIATHSPFVLSDVLVENTLYLKDGKREEVAEQTFGGNFYDMLKSSFFFDKNAIGDVAARTYSNLIKEKNKKGVKPSEEYLKMVGDSFVRAYLKLSNHDVQDNKG